MTKKIIYHKKLIRALIVALISLCALLQWQNLNAQNFVGSGGEMVMFSSIHLGTSTNWATNRSAAPGYFSWENGSSTYTGADDAHNIDGYVKKYGIDAFMFPVGTGTDLRTLSISAPTVATDTYGVAWIVGDPTTTGDPTNSNAFHNVSTVNLPIVKVSTSGQWDWQAINGTGDGLTVTVSTPDVSGMATAAELRLVGWDGSKWINLSTAGASANTENGILSGTMVAGIEALGIGHVDLTPPLPPVITTVTTNPNGTLTITGTGEPNTEAKITLPSGEIITTPVGPTGIFGPVTSINPQPTGNINTVIIDPSGNISPPTVTPYVDVTPPIAPTITTVTPNPNGTINVSGTAEPGSTVTVTFPDGSTGTAITDPSGNYGPVTSITPQPSGLVKAKAVDAAGNISPEVTKPYVDTTPPLPPVITTVTTNPNGTLTITGTGEPNTEAKITLPSGEIITTPVGPTGIFGPVTSINPQPTGNISTVIIDPAGNISPPTVTPYVDVTPPIAPTITTVTPNPNGTINVSGTAEPGSTVTVTFPDGSTGTAVTDPSGNYGPVTSITPQPSGLVKAKAVDAAGNISPEVTKPYVDTTPPLPPVITTVTTNPNGTLTIIGIGEPGTEAKITLPSGEIITAPVGPNGVFGPVTSINPQPTGNITTLIIDPAGNISPPTVTPYVSLSKPDLSPGLDIDDLGFTKNPLGEKDFIVDIFEANVGETSAPIVFRITKLPSFDISIPGIIISGTDQSGISGTSSVAGGRPNENGNWLFKQNASSVTISSKPGVKITKAGLASIGFHIKLKTGVATGTKQNINIVIISGTGGGDNNIINDLSSTLISVN